ncbi:DUF4012 domain-containing protein [Arthrobacter subterraneus]|uniref:DUF4012 domain-containing protein n=1 Tax=Arthrobacter subterraneus TaxID=335973 RepID=UPI003826BC66
MTQSASETTVEPSDAQRMAHRKRTKLGARVKRRIAGRIIVAAAVLLLVACGYAAWLMFRADQIKTSLESALVLLPTIQEQLMSGEGEAARQTLTELQKHTSVARVAATDPVWRGASLVPVAGGNFSAVTEVAVSADDIVNLAIGPLVGGASSVDWSGLMPTEGKIDLAALQQSSASLSSARNTVQLSYDRLSAVDTSELLPEVSQPLEQVTAALDTASDALDGASAAAEVLPPMLGAEGPRNHLLLIQNSAEVRATGGIPGALAVIHTDDGEIELTAQGSASELGRFDPTVVVDPAQIEIYSTRMGRFMQSVNLTPDFPTAAQTAAKMWEQHHKGLAIDGVLALDPLALANILKATGPVELRFQEPEVGDLVASSGLPTSLTAENVVPTLLSDVYAAIEEPSLQDAYFAAVAAQVFEALTSGDGESAGLVQSLIKSADEGRLYAWSAHSNEQAIIASTGMAGKVTGAEAGGATFGAYFNDGTGAKMDFYVRRTVQLKRSCTEDGYLQYTLMITLTNTAPLDAAELLPDYVTGGGDFGVPPGTVQTNVVGYGPDQSQLQTARVNGEPAPIGSYRHGDRPVAVVTTRLPPAQSATVEVDFSNVVQTSDPVLDVTPTIQPIDDVVLPLQGGAACS